MTSIEIEEFCKAALPTNLIELRDTAEMLIEQAEKGLKEQLSDAQCVRVLLDGLSDYMLDIEECRALVGMLYR